MDTPEQNTDKELFREVKEDYYSPSLHVTRDGLIGIDVGGSVHVMSLREWHKRAESFVVKTETTHNSDYRKLKLPVSRERCVKKLCPRIVAGAQKEIVCLTQKQNF